MTTELKQAIEVLKMNRPLIGRIGDEVMEAIDTVVAEVEKPKYMADDMEAFAEWIGRNAFPCDSKEWWTINETGEEVTTTELREIWEQSMKEEAE